MKFRPEPQPGVPAMILENGFRAPITSIQISDGGIYLVAEGLGPVQPGQGWIAVVGDDDTVFSFVDGQTWFGSLEGHPYRFMLSVQNDPTPPAPRWTADGKLVGNIAMGGMEGFDG